MKKSLANYIYTCIVASLFSIVFHAQLFSQDSIPEANETVAVAASDDGIPTDETVISSGETLFTNYCKQCHAIHDQVIGPALAGVYERRDIEWLTGFIVNSQKVIQGGDPYAVALYEKFNKLEMPAHDLSDEQVLSILAYVKAETIKGPAQLAQTAGADVTTETGDQGSTLLSSGYITFFIVALLVVMALILIVLLMLVSILTKYLKQKADVSEQERAFLEQRPDFRKMVRSPAVVLIVVFIFTAIVLKSVIDGLYSVGVQQGYAPTQPIAFSHKLHAGQYKIDCQYCHTGVTNSASANIPSANICMNCHQSIVKLSDATELSVEIQKIRDAIENDQPIEWIRVHNLPDLAYFNHAQHFNVGGIECQTCHGVVEEMEVLEQFSNLTMGWCIDCHRTNDINTENNGYYDQLVKLHKETSKEPLKVEDMGGLECAKCHY